MTYWYHTHDSQLPDRVAEFGLPIEVHGNWWWQPSGAVTTYPLPDGQGVPLHISDLVAAGNGDADALARVNEAWWEWTHEYPDLGCLMQEQLAYQADQMERRLNGALSTVLSQWIDAGQRDSYWDALARAGISVDYGLKAVLAALEQAPSGVRKAVCSIIDGQDFQSFARALVEEELETTFPGILKTHPGILCDLPGTPEDNGLECLPLTIDRACLWDYAEMQWRNCGFEPCMPLEPESLFQNIHQQVRQQYDISGVSSAVGIGHRLDALAHDAMRQINMRPKEERYAICIDAIPIHLLTDDRGMGLTQRAIRSARGHLGTLDTKGATLGYVDTNGRVYMHDAAQIRRKLSREPHGLEKMMGETGALSQQQAESIFKEALTEELTHRVQIGTRRPKHFEAAGMSRLLRHELTRCDKLPDPPSSLNLACEKMRRQLNALRVELDQYDKRYDKRVRLGIHPAAGKEEWLDNESYAKLHDIWALCSSIEGDALQYLVPASTAYLEELHGRTRDLLPETQEEKRRADRAVAEWLIASASQDTDKVTAVMDGYGADR
ncbi:hypothetical protein GC177_09490 [bacterium]|nr:hypothetical protein [bacterium]